MSLSMTILTYRGVRYTAEKHQVEFKTWWNRIHCDATRYLTYRGAAYRTYSQCQL